MERKEVAEKMLQAINEEYKTGKIPKEVYHILMERWGGAPEEIAEEEMEAAVEEAEPGQRLPSHAGPEDIDAVVTRLLKERRNLEGEIVELEVEKESVEGTLKGLEKKLSAGTVEKHRFAKISRQYTAKIKEIDVQIIKKHGEIESIGRRLKRMKTEIQKKIGAYTQALQKVEKAIEA